MTAMNKREMRAYLHSLHEGQAVRDEQSAALCRHILLSDAYREARVIGEYMPMPREADITPVLEDALRRGKTVALPLCGDAPHMTLNRIASLDELVPGKYGILEPAHEAPMIPVRNVELLLIPLEGIDQAGFRLGKGGGYYDSLLAEADITAIGCALSWQWVDKVPRDSWDKPLSACADMYGIHWFKR